MENCVDLVGCISYSPSSNYRQKNNIIVTNSESTTMKKQNSVYYRSFGIAFLLLKLYVKDGQFGASLTGYRPCDTSRDMILFRMNK